MAKTTSFDEALVSALKYFNGDSIAAKLWVEKYALKNEDGNIIELTPDDMHHRLAHEIARIEANYPSPLTEDEVFELLDHFRYIIPGARSMMGIGNNNTAESLSNCFVIGLDGASDSYGAIMHTDEEQVQIMKRRGGVGHDLSQLRPKGYAIKNSPKTSMGLVPFMERYSNTAQELFTNGQLMLSVSVKHPETEDFIDAKLTEGKVSGANVALKIDDDFIRAVINNRAYTQQFPITSDAPTIKQSIIANDLWKKLVHNIWQSAEPSILFWDRIINDSITDCYSSIGYSSISTSPHGEIALCRYDSCRLLVLNLYSYVVNPFTQEAKFDYELFAKHTAMAHKIADDIVDLDIEKLKFILKKIDEDPENEEVKRTEKHLWEKILHMAQTLRRIGIGIIGKDEAVAAMNQKFGSDEEYEFLIKIHRDLAINIYRSSVTLAKERGAFAIYDATKEQNNPFIGRIREADEALYNDMVKHGRRNISCLAIISSENQKLTMLAQKPVNTAKNDTDSITRVKMLGNIQKWVDHSISVDIDLPAKSDEQLIAKTYIEAWRNGCKNCNVHREGAHASEPLQDKKEAVPYKQPVITETRPQVLNCDVVRFQNNKEKWVAFVGLLDGYPYEIFTGLQDDDEGIALPKSVTKGKIIKNILPDGSKRYDFQFENKRGYKTTVEGLSEKFNKEYWNYAKLISGVLRYRMPTQYVIKLVGSLQLENESINTWKNGVKMALKKYVVDGTEAKGVFCPNCGHESLVYQNGSLICKDCGEVR